MKTSKHPFSPLLYLNNAFVPAGRLIFDSQGRFSKAFFRYGEQYLQRKDAVSIDPVQLPLNDIEFETEPGFEMFNGIRDAGLVLSDGGTGEKLGGLFQGMWCKFGRYRKD